MKFSKPVYLVAAKRTAIGSLQGMLSTVPSTELGAKVITGVIAEAKLDPQHVDQVILGSVLTAGQGQAPARQAALKAGLPVSTQAFTVNKVCSSGLKAVILAANEIELGAANIVIAGGMENMSLSPYILPSLRTGARLGNTQAIDTMVNDGLWDPYNNYHMGNAAELCAREMKISREDQDRYALESYARAKTAIEAGWFKKEIVSVPVGSGKTATEFSVDEEPGKLKAEKVPELRPVFDKSGTVTAANASSINDGAAAMIVCSEAALKQYGLTPLARVVAHGWNSREPEWFTMAPVGAMERLVQFGGTTIDALDLVELNEAFATVAVACQRELKIDPTKLNVSGGAVALGHPIGASGARILTTLLYNLERLALKRGAVGICNGGGEATALLVERV